MQALDPDFLRTFIAITETGTYEAAGLKVNKTQSAVSAQVKRLEEILGATLFEKSGRRNVLTASGRRLVPGTEARHVRDRQHPGVVGPGGRLAVEDVDGVPRYAALEQHLARLRPRRLQHAAGGSRRRRSRMSPDLRTGRSRRVHRREPRHSRRSRW
jgi:hypothetical protein